MGSPPGYIRCFIFVHMLEISNCPICSIEKTEHNTNAVTATPDADVDSTTAQLDLVRLRQVLFC